MNLNEIAAEWAKYPDQTTDASNDYALRSIEPMRRNKRGSVAPIECGHCGDEFTAATAGSHVAECKGEKRRSDRRKYAAWR